MSKDSLVEEVAKEINGRITDDGIQVDDGNGSPIHVHLNDDERTFFLASQRPLYSLKRGRFVPVAVGDSGEDVGWYYVPSVRREHLRPLLDRALSETVPQEADFAYESLLRDHLASDVSCVFANLKVFHDGTRIGIEYPVDGRYIDILAVDSSGDFYVFELKLSLGHERVIGQLLRYMGWVAEHLAHGKRVFGVLVARQITYDLRLAISRLDDVAAFEYSIDIKTREIKGLTREN